MRSVFTLRARKDGFRASDHLALSSAAHRLIEIHDPPLQTPLEPDEL
jgi:hypothetical protein